MTFAKWAVGLSDLPFPFAGHERPGPKVVYTDILQFFMLVLFVYIMVPISSISSISGLGKFLSGIDTKYLIPHVDGRLLGDILSYLVITMAGARSRIMGVLLYYHGVEGYLHWGFNFYNSQCSVEHIDPFQVTDAGEAFPSGDPFLVYPAPDGTAWDSIRGMVIRQSLNDLRALKLLEGKIGRPAVRAMLEELAGRELTFTCYPQDSAFSRQCGAEYTSGCKAS